MNKKPKISDKEKAKADVHNFALSGVGFLIVGLVFIILFAYGSGYISLRGLVVISALVYLIWSIISDIQKDYRTREHLAIEHKPKSSGWKTFFVVLVVIFSLLFSRGLFSPSEELASQSTIQSNNSIKPSNFNVEDKIKENIVWVKYEVSGKNEDGSYFGSSGTGSGVIARNEDNELTVYTNRHVVDCQYNDIKCFQRISENIQVRTRDGKLHKVDRVYFSKSDIDLAILSIKDSNAASYSAALLYRLDFEIGEKVIAVGYPSYTENVVEFSIKEGKITNIKEVLSQSSGKNFIAVESDAYTYFGSSGGGLFDTQGNLIGINTWRATGQSIAIAFNSISEEGFTYCDKGSYSSNGYCQNYCERKQVLGSGGRCYDVCDGYYCKSTIPQVNSQSCSDSTYVLGSDDYCHAACTINSYCPRGSICYKNQCLSCSFGTYLYEDGTCRKYE